MKDILIRVYEKATTSSDDVHRTIVDEPVSDLESFCENVWGEEVRHSETYRDIARGTSKNSLALSRMYEQSLVPSKSVEDMKKKVMSYAHQRVMKEAYKISEEILGDEAQSVNVDGHIVDITLAEELYF